MKPVLRYLDIRPLGALGSRGNAVRLYMLVNKIDFTEELVTFKDWGASEKARCIQEYNPAGNLPVLLVGNKIYAEHVSICRYLARKQRQYGADEEMDFLADAAADAYTDWINAWDTALEKPGTHADVVKYRTTRSKFYKTQEWYYGHRACNSSPYLTGGTIPGFVDLIVYNMVRDDAIMHTPVDLHPYPLLKSLYEFVDNYPEVKAWVTKWEAETLAMKSA